jgi:hypothetical protein
MTAEEKMTSKNLLRIAAGLCLMTFAGHTIGMISPVPPDQVNVQSVYSLMKETVVMMPMGGTKTIATLMVGANACLSVLLFLAAAFYFLFGKQNRSKIDQNQLLILNLAMIAVSVISWLCFFPMPALCTGIAGILGIVASRKDS